MSKIEGERCTGGNCPKGRVKGPRKLLDFRQDLSDFGYFCIEIRNHDLLRT